MAKFKRTPVLETDGVKTALIAETVNDNDKGKPVVLDTTAPDRMRLAAATEVPDGFISSIEDATSDGKQIIGYDTKSMRTVEAVGAMVIGDYVEVAASQPAAGTAFTNKIPTVSVHTVVLADSNRWRVVSASTGDAVVASGDTQVVIERIQ